MASRAKWEQRGGAAAKEAKRQYVGAGAGRRLSAGDAAVEGSAWDECNRQQRHDTRVSGAGKNVGGSHSAKSVRAVRVPNFPS